MAKFIIQPYGRLNDWVAEEKGYFAAEGLDFELNVEGSRKNTPRLATVDSPGALEDSRFWRIRTVRGGTRTQRRRRGRRELCVSLDGKQAAKVKKGLCGARLIAPVRRPSSLPGDSSVFLPADLAGTDIAVGYHSGSHYSALQALDRCPTSSTIPPGIWRRVFRR